MRAQEFCYWLQGFFEIGGEPVSPLNARQVEVLKNHLRLVDAIEADKSMRNKPYAFCVFLSVELEKAKPEWHSISSSLDSLFEHVIDKTYGGDSAHLANLHGNKQGTTTMRC